MKSYRYRTNGIKDYVNRYPQRDDRKIIGVKKLQHFLVTKYKLLRITE